MITGVPEGVAADPESGPSVPALPTDADIQRLIAEIWSPAFPSPDMVEAAAALLPSIREAWGEQREGPTWRLSVAPGLVAVGTVDYAARYRREQREHDARVDMTDAIGAWGADKFREWVAREGIVWSDEEAEAEGGIPARVLDAWAAYCVDHPITRDPMPSRRITEWSRKSRARMVRRLCELDYGALLNGPDGRPHGRLPAMITLTYPGDWQIVAPTGAESKAHLRAFRERYRRAWGTDLACIWKLEFQGRGAPHYHLLMCPPEGRDEVRGLRFREWLSRTWADVVGHPDPEERRKHLAAGTGVDYAQGLRSSDPRRTAVYFLKHNVAGQDDKQYQHVVPEEWSEPGTGPGRFWGYWVLRPAVSTVELRTDEAVAAARVMRRWSRAQGRTRVVRRPRMRGGRLVPVRQDVAGLTGAQLLEAQAQVPTRYRKTTVRVVNVAHGRGWLALNDGPSFAGDLARYLELRRGHPAPGVTPPRAPRRPAAAPIGVADLGLSLEPGTGAWRAAVSSEDPDVTAEWSDPPPTDRERIRRLVDWQAAWARVREVDDLLIPDAVGVSPDRAGVGGGSHI